MQVGKVERTIVRAVEADKTDVDVDQIVKDLQTKVEVLNLRSYNWERIEMNTVSTSTSNVSMQYGAPTWQLTEGSESCSGTEWRTRAAL